MPVEETLWLLDTNIVSHILKGNKLAIARLTARPMSTVRISAITEGELRFGLARRPDAIQLHRVVREFLARVQVDPWDSTVAEVYGELRASLQRRGLTVDALDLLIGAHAKSIGAVLVSNDKIFTKIPDFKTDDWTIPDEPTISV